MLQMLRAVTVQDESGWLIEQKACSDLLWLAQETSQSFDKNEGVLLKVLQPKAQKKPRVAQQSFQSRRVVEAPVAQGL